MLESAAEAVRQGDVDHLCEILDVCRDAATRPISSFENQTLLHVAAKTGQSRCLEAILTSNECRADKRKKAQRNNSELLFPFRQSRRERRIEIRPGEIAFEIGDKE